MKTHFSDNNTLTACGRRITRFAIDAGRPNLWYYSDWEHVDCTQCLRAKMKNLGEYGSKDKKDTA